MLNSKIFSRSWMLFVAVGVLGGCGDSTAETTDSSTTSAETGAVTTTGTLATDTTDTPTSTGESTGPGTGTGTDSTTDLTTGTGSSSTGTTDPTDTSSTGEPVLCGNAMLDDGEACDDGLNDGAYGGCAPDCSALGPNCGDSEVNGPESCDDGNMVDDDECTNACALASCGDGIKQADEACDDANDVETDACLVTCVAAKCGDTFVQEGVEACDDGNAVETDACLATCVAATCGDKFVQEGVEVCDDGVNDNSYGGCAMDCKAKGPFCGDKVKNGAEECDDGNMVDNDMCSNTCKAVVAVNVTFTNCGQTLENGPSQAQCNLAYPNGNQLNGKVTVTAGIQSWTVPATGTYRVEAWGAEGGTQSNYGPGGKGAHVRGDIMLTQGEVLKVLVGQMGKTGTLYDVGGGGGSFVVKTMGNVPLIVAGGGGAPGNCGVANLAAQHGKGADGNGNGGTSGNNGTWCGCGGDGSAGGGFSTNGGGDGGKAFINGGKGADTERPGQCVDSGLGGFGGGGNGGNGGPGGGGYQGGDAGGSGAPGQVPYGTGGKSYTTGANKIQEDGIQAGHGKVTIVKL
jgi:cysteine-rich repeat protein